MNVKKTLIILFSLIYVFTFDVFLVFSQIPDITPPELLSFDFNPKVIDATGEQRPTVTATITFRDDQTGISGVDVSFGEPISMRAVSVNNIRVISVSPDTLTQTWELDFRFDAFSPPGTWIPHIWLTDRAANRANFTADILQSMGFPTQLFNGNTPPGRNTVVGPLSGVNLIFSDVTTGGQTTVTSSSSGPTPPSGFKLGTPPTYYSISTTAQFNPPVTICISYDDTQFKNEKNLKLFHFESGAWSNVTTSLDTTNNVICGQVSSFSEFALLEGITADHLIDEVKSFNLKPDVEQGLLDKLNAAKSAIERNQKKTAVNILKAFTNQVKAQKGKALTNEQANLLTTDTRALIESLGGNLLSTIFKWIFFGWLDKFVSAMLSVKI